MLDRSLPSPVVFKYYLYRAAAGPGFIYPIYVLYLLSQGLSFAHIGVIGAVQSVIVVGGELPTGYVGDRIGRRNSLLVGQALFAAASVGFVVGSSFPAFLVAFALLSFGGTFVSGSGDAWLYDSLEERLDGSRFTHVRGRGAAVGQWVTAVTMVLGGVLYVVDPVVPFLALLVMRLATFGVVLTMPKTAQYADDAESEASGADLTVLDAVPIIREELLRPPLRSFVAYMALFLGVLVTVDAFIQPIAVDGLEATVGEHLAAFGVPEAAVLGVLYASFTAVSAVASDRASDLVSLLGLRRAVLVVPFVTAVLMALPALLPLLAFPMFFGVKAANSVLEPVAGQYVNDHVDSVGRATVLSAVAMVYALARVPFTLGSGVIGDVVSPLAAVAAMGATFLVGGTVFVLLWPPVGATAVDGTPAGTTTD